MTDMHQPVSPGEWPFILFPLKWFRFIQLETVTYFEQTVPQALNRLWSWRDATFCFYFVPLASWQDQEGQWWGFQIVSFETESQRWWLKFALMPVARIIAKKVRISNAEAKERQAVLAVVVEAVGLTRKGDEDL